MKHQGLTLAAGQRAQRSQYRVCHRGRSGGRRPGPAHDIPQQEQKGVAGRTGSVPPSRVQGDERLVHDFAGGADIGNEQHGQLEEGTGVFRIKTGQVIARTQSHTPHPRAAQTLASLTPE